eukprot:6630287-Prymnesium_polylepis.1
MTNSVSWAPFPYTPASEVPNRGFGRAVLGMPWHNGIEPSPSKQQLTAQGQQGLRRMRPSTATPQQPRQAVPNHFELCASEYARAYQWHGRPQSAPAGR